MRRRQRLPLHALYGIEYQTYSGASCVRTLRRTRALRGRISIKPTRKRPYAVRTPKAIDPTAAQTNITRFNASAISSDPRRKIAGEKFLVGISAVWARLTFAECHSVVSRIVSEILSR